MGKKGKKRKLPWAWQLFPAYGLRIRDDDGLHAPLFRDATLVSHASAQNLVTHHGSVSHPLLSHGKFVDTLGKDALASLGMPAEGMVEIVPDSYVAVRSRGDDAKNRHRADEIRALLSATLFLRAGRIQAVAAEPRHVTWYIAPCQISIQQGKPVECSAAPVLNEHVLLKPLEVSKEHLRSSARVGSHVPNSRGWQWDIHAEHPVCRLLTEPKAGKFKRRLIASALQIQEASCAVSYTVQLQMAVAALEMVLGTRSFKDLEKRLKAFFVGEEWGSRIQAILKTRHRATHEGSHSVTDFAKELAAHAIAAAWIMLDVAVAFSDQMTGGEFEEYTQVLAEAVQLDSRIAKLVQRESSGQRSSVDEAFKHLSPRLTGSSGRSSDSMAG